MTEGVYMADGNPELSMEVRVVTQLSYRVSFGGENLPIDFSSAVEPSHCNEPVTTNRPLSAEELERTEEQAQKVMDSIDPRLLDAGYRRRSARFTARIAGIGAATLPSGASITSFFISVPTIESPYELNEVVGPAIGVGLGVLAVRTYQKTSKRMYPKVLQNLEKQNEEHKTYQAIRNIARRLLAQKTAS